MAKNKGIARAKKEQRRKEALERQAAYDDLTPTEKLAKLDKGGFRAKKQRARLEKEIEVGKEKIQ